MKILLLIILMTHYFGGIKDMPVTQKVVSSPKEAAVLLWDRQQSVSYPEPKTYQAHLYEIDLEKMTVKEIDIPTISFQSEASTRPDGAEAQCVICGKSMSDFPHQHEIDKLSGGK